MGAVRYNNQRLVPAPFVGISKEYQKSGQQNIGSLFTINVTGRILPHKGSPTSSGTFFDDRIVYSDGSHGDTRVQRYPADESNQNKLASFLAKEHAIRELFAQEGKKFEIEACEAPTSDTFLTPSGSMYCFPRINNISFAEGQWFNTVDYTITLECDEMFGLEGSPRHGGDGHGGAEDAQVSGEYFLDGVGNKLYLQEAAEDWSLEFNDVPEKAKAQPSFRLTHNLSAVGKKAYNADGLVSQAWEQARRWVHPRLGLDTTFLHSTSGLKISPGHVSSPVLNGFNHTRTENTDELAGSYSVNESWIVSSGNILEDFTVDINTSADSGKTTATINGTITGLETRNTNFEITQSKWHAAEAHFDTINSGPLGTSIIFNRVSSYSGLTNINSNALTSTIGKNPVAGTITYNTSYDDRNSPCISSAIPDGWVAKKESIVITDANSHDVFATIPVIGRAAGPVLQDLSTITATTRSVAIDLTVANSGICPKTEGRVGHFMDASPKAEVALIIAAFRADLDTKHTQVFKNADQETWDPWNGRYTRNVGWTYQSCD